MLLILIGLIKTNRWKLYQELIMKEYKGYIHSFQSLGTVDGPGLRFVVFLYGCPLKCIYCHNPDTQNIKKHSNFEYTKDQIVKKVLKMKPYFKNEGGVTLSGGEPFLQSVFLLELVKQLKDDNINIAIDTSGYILNEEVKKRKKE